MTTLLYAGIFLGMFGIGSSIVTVARPSAYKDVLLVWHAWIGLVLGIMLVALVMAV